MQLIHCPWCGPREEVEFHYGGQADVAYPDNPADLSDQEWAEFVFYRDNQKGPYPERWSHSAGCRRWFNAVRDTRTYEFLAIYKVGEPVPATTHWSSQVPTSVQSNRTSGDRDANQPQETAKREIALDATTTVNRGEAELHRGEAGLV